MMVVDAEVVGYVMRVLVLDNEVRHPVRVAPDEVEHDWDLSGLVDWLGCGEGIVLNDFRQVFPA